MRYLYSINGERREIEYPDDWELEISPLGYEVWLHKKDEAIGIADSALSIEEALEKVRRRVRDWREFDTIQRRI